MDNNIVVGLDIGTTKVVAIVGERSESGKYNVIGYGHSPSSGVVRGEVRNVNNTAKSIATAVEKAREISGVDIQEVYFGIAGQHIRTRQIQRDNTRSNPDEQISSKEIKEFTKRQYNLDVSADEKIIHVLPQFFTLDNHPDISENDIVGMIGNQLSATFHIVTANSKELRKIYLAIQQAGLSVAGCILEPFASAEAVLDTRDREVGVVLADIGGGTTDLAIFNDGILIHSAVIPIAGNTITKDIEKGCSLLPDISEKLKVQFGAVFPDSDGDNKIISIPGYRNQAAREISQTALSELIKSRVKEILECVDYEIRNLNSSKPFIGGVVLTGGGSKLPGIIQFSEYITEIDSRQGFANENLEESPFSDTLKDPIFATAIGLLILGIRSEEEKEEFEKNTGANTIISNTPEAPADSEIPTTETPKPEKKEKKKGNGFMKTASSWVTKFFDPEEDKIN